MRPNGPWQFPRIVGRMPFSTEEFATSFTSTMFSNSVKYFPFLINLIISKNSREQGHRTLTGNDEEQDELLFDYFFEGTVQKCINETENCKINFINFIIIFGNFSSPIISFIGHGIGRPIALLAPIGFVE